MGSGEWGVGSGEWGLGTGGDAETRGRGDAENNQLQMTIPNYELRITLA
ncbi:MAG: hypothetical protein KME21_13740 [Desmonostoc vinosum HA7617-LM4]|nr:hypothetical protein [Desmonostoc vinosum HA7617-LM4]